MTVCGSNGHVLFACNVNYANQDGFLEPCLQIMIPIETIKTLKKKHDKEKYKTHSITLESISGGAYVLGDQRFEPVKGRYPDYRQIIPNVDSKPKDKPHQFSQESFKVCIDALTTFYGSSESQMEHLENCCVLHSGKDDAVAVFKPYKAREFPSYKGFSDNSVIDEKANSFVNNLKSLGS